MAGIMNQGLLAFNCRTTQSACCLNIYKCIKCIQQNSSTLLSAVRNTILGEITTNKQNKDKKYKKEFDNPEIEFFRNFKQEEILREGS